MTSKLTTAIRVGTSLFSQRTGQLIVNALDNNDDLFYLTDDELAQKINDYVNEHNPYKDTVRKDLHSDMPSGYIRQKPTRSH